MKTAALVQRNASGPKAANGRGGSRIPFFPAAVERKQRDAVQARLQLGRRGDRFELEADRVADRVVDGKAARPDQRGLADGITPLTQRAEEEEAQSRLQDEEPVQAQVEEEEEEPVQAQAEEEEEEPVQAQAEEEEEESVQPQAEEEKEEPVQAQAEEEEEESVQAQAEEEEEEPVQARAAGVGGLPVAADVARQIRAARGRGNPLPGPVREKMEAQFDADFSGVRIHTDAPAVLLAKALRAQAFTRGNDIFFNEGKFAPASRAGEHLLAHELTHTVQQRAVEPNPPSGETDSIRLAPDAAADADKVRPEVAEAIRLARGEIGKVNAKRTGGDGKRVGWQRLREYFDTAFGGPVVSEQVVDRIVMIERTRPDGTREKKDALPSWCGIFTWWAMKKAGIPVPDWKLGAPALDALKPRAVGELPRKGDIALDVVPYNHFAMVTGLESAADVQGNPGKLLRIATVNGNTAGADNLGGQIQERWDPPSRWDHFLDPVGKMNLPEAPLVPATRESAPGSEGAPSPAAEAETEKRPEDEAPRPEVADLDTAIAAPEPEAVGGPMPQPDLSLPPPADAGPAEKVATIEAVDLAGSSDQATTNFIDAAPSAMATAQPALGPTVGGKLASEQQDLAQNPPVLEARTSGEVDAPVVGPDDIPIPGDTRLGDGVKGADSGAIDPFVAPAPNPFRGNAAREAELEKENSGSFWDAFKNFLRGFVSGIRTTDDGIDTSTAGVRPNVALEGNADPTRMDSQREEGTAKLTAQRDVQTEAFRNHPGQSNIQPRKLDEQFRAEVSETPAVEIEAQDDAAVRDYAAAPLPADVRDAADAKIAARLTPDLAEARGQTVASAAARDSEKRQEIDTAQRAAAELNSETDTAQRRLVTENRTKVAGLQGEGIGAAYEQVNKFAADAANEQNAKRKDIGEHVRSEEGKARNELRKGEEDAEKEKRKGEREAAEKKRALEKEQEKGSWWDRVKSAIKKAVKAVTEAIDAAFTAVRKLVKTIIEKAKNAAIGLINAARDWVVDRLNGFRDWAKSQVDKYLKDAFPGLARRINAGIDAVTDKAIAGVNAVADAAIEGINRLADALAAALDKILSTFQTALKTAVRVVGAVLQGDFAEALRAAIEGACEIAGVDPKPVFDFLDRAGKAIMSILRDPVPFIKKLFGAVGTGIANFFKNIKQHLIQGVIGWLTGALGEANITGPFEFTPKGILKIVLQVLGLTYANIKARVIRKVPAAAKVFDIVEKGFELLRKLVTEGPGALWEEIKSRLSDLKETVMGAIRNWLITTVIKEGITWLLSLTNPASAIVKAIKLLFDLVMFLVERYQQIKDFILSVYESVAAIAAGNFTKVTTAVENALARVVPVLISLLASILGLGGIAQQVKKVIQSITRPINRAIDTVIDKIVAFAKKVLGKLKTGAKKAKEKIGAAVQKIATWWRERRKFKSKDGGSHSIYYKGTGKKAELMIASTPDRIEKFLAAKAKDSAATAEKRQVASEGLAQYKIVLQSEDRIEQLRAARANVSTKDKAKYRAASSAVNAEIRKFRTQLDALKKILERATFESADDALVRTHVVYGVGGDKSTMAMPLTYLSGNEKGSSPYQDPPGWSHVVALDTKPDGSSRHQWVRGHLLNDNLHGPGKAANLVPITQGMNRKMEADVEAPAKTAIKSRGKLFFYKAVATFWRLPAPVDVFPQKIVVTWGSAERDASDSTKFKEKAAHAPITFEMPSAPPVSAEAFVPSINRDGPTALLFALKKQDPAITSYFVNEILIGNRTYSSKTKMKETLWLKGASVQAATRRRYVKSTYAAVGTHVTMN